VHVDGAGVLLLEYQLRLRGVVRFITYRTYLIIKLLTFNPGYLILLTALEPHRLMLTKDKTTHSVRFKYATTVFHFASSWSSPLAYSLPPGRAHTRVAELTKSSILGHPLAPVAQVCRRIDGGIDKRPRSSAKATQSTP